MNIKKLFGVVLTTFGIGALIYTAVLFVNNSGGGNNIRSLFTFGILGLVFFSAGISLVRTTSDAA